MAKDRKALILALSVFLFAFLVRLIGIGWGLPNDHQYYSLHPDEDLIYEYAQQIEPAKLDFTPGFYNYGTFYLTLLRVTSDVVGAYGGAGEIKSESDYAAAKGSAELGGRVLSALAGAGTALIVLLILLPRVGHFGAILGAVAMALAPGHVVHSRFQTVDVLATFLLSVSLYFALRLTEEGHTDKAVLKFAAFAGLFAGLSAGTKYTGILALTALAAVVLFDRRKVAWTGLAVGILTAVVAFFITTPGAITESAAFMSSFKYEMTHTQQGHGLVFAGTPNGYLYHLWNLIIAVNTLILLLGLFGLLRAVIKKHAWAVALVAFAVVYYILIGRAEVKFMRYVFPLVPIVAIGFGWIIGRARIHPRPSVQAGVLAVAMFGIASAAAVMARWSMWMTETDARIALANDIKSESNEDTTVGLASDPWFYTPTLYPQSAAGPMAGFENRMKWMLEARSPRVVRYVPEVASERFDFDKRLLTELYPDYVVLSSFEIGDINRLNKLPSPPSEFATQLERAEEFMDTLRTGYELWKVQGVDGAGLPHDLRYIRPDIEVWKRKTDSPTQSTGSSTTSEPNEAQAPTP